MTLKKTTMNKFSIFLLGALCSTATAFAQVDRTTYPEPGPAPQINLGDPATFTLPNGLTVFVVENHKLPRVTYSLVLDLEPILQGAKAGLTSFVVDLLMVGRKTVSTDKLDEALDRIERHSVVKRKR